MEKVWRLFLPIAATHHWAHGGKPHPAVQFDPHFRILSNADYTNLNDERVRLYADEFQRLAVALREAPAILERLAELANAGYANELWRRDALDITRTIINRALKASLLRGCVAMEAWRTGCGDEAAVRQMETVSKGLMQQLGDLLALSDDFSLHATMRRLEKARELGGVEPRINPHTEQTLKGNAENSYCRAHQYELVRRVYQPELDEYWKWVAGQLQSSQKKQFTRPASFTASGKTIQDRFYEMPLADMAPTRARSAGSLRQTIEQTRKLLATLLTSKP
jgi:hypothetical protein